MYRNGEQISSTDVHNFVFNHSALGDMISSLPAVIFARQLYHKNLKMKVWVTPWQADLIKHLLAPYGEFEYGDFLKFPLKLEERKKTWTGGPISYNAAIGDTYTRCRVNMVDYAFNFLLNARPETMAQRNYPTAALLVNKPYFPFDQKYVVFPVGATSDNKLFRASVMGPVMKWCQDNGYRTVLVGTKTNHTGTMEEGVMRPIVIREQTDLLPVEIFERCVDWREKTTLLELRDILGYAAAVVGVDGGTLHLAGTTDVPIVFSSGTTLPKHRFIVRQGDPNHRIRYVGPRDLECYGCQSNWPMTNLHFTRCAYNDNLCMEKLHPDDFITGLKELGL